MIRRLTENATRGKEMAVKTVRDRTPFNAKSLFRTEQSTKGRLNEGRELMVNLKNQLVMNSLTL